MKKLWLIAVLFLVSCVSYVPEPNPPVQYIAEAYEYCDPPGIICDVGLECWHTDYWKGDMQFCSPECNTSVDCQWGYWCATGYVNYHCMPW